MPGLAQLGHRGPQVGGRDRAEEARPHHALGVGDHRGGHGVDAVAVVQVLAGRRPRPPATATAADSSSRALLPHARAGVAGGRGEHRDQPGGVGSGEVGRSSCGGHVVAGAAPARPAGWRRWTTAATTAATDGHDHDDDEPLHATTLPVDPAASPDGGCRRSRRRVGDARRRGRVAGRWSAGRRRRWWTTSGRRPSASGSSITIVSSGAGSSTSSGAAGHVVESSVVRVGRRRPRSTSSSDVERIGRQPEPLRRRDARPRWTCPARRRRRGRGRARPRSARTSVTTIGEVVAGDLLAQRMARALPGPDLDALQLGHRHELAADDCGHVDLGEDLRVEVDQDQPLVGCRRWPRRRRRSTARPRPASRS